MIPLQPGYGLSNRSEQRESVRQEGIPACSEARKGVDAATGPRCKLQISTWGWHGCVFPGLKNILSARII